MFLHPYRYALNQYIPVMALRVSSNNLLSLSG
jgi:hypothetical protein